MLKWNVHSNLIDGSIFGGDGEMKKRHTCRDGIIGNFLQSHRAAFSLMKGPRKKEKKEDTEMSEQVESHYDGQHEIGNKRN